MSFLKSTSELFAVFPDIVNAKYATAPARSFDEVALSQHHVHTVVSRSPSPIKQQAQSAPPFSHWSRSNYEILALLKSISGC